MKALTVQQPWAWAIFHGKGIENRTQAWGYRGPLAIHAGGRWSDRGGESDLVAREWAIERRVKPEFGDLCYPLPRQDFFPTGAIIGVVDLVDVHHCVHSGGRIDCCESPWAETSYDEHGGYTRREIVHLVLERPRLLAIPIPAKGRLGLWTPDADVLEQLAAVA